MNSQQGTLSQEGLAMNLRRQARLGECMPGRASPRGCASGSKPSAYACASETSRMNSRQGTDFPAWLAANFRPKQKTGDSSRQGPSLRSEFLVPIFGSKATSEVNARQCALQGSLVWLAAALRLKRKKPQE